MHSNCLFKQAHVGFISLICVFSASAQSNFLPGSVTRTNGEKLQGLVDYRQWTRNPKTIVYKAGLGTEAIEFKPIEVKHFEVTGEDRYESAIVKKNMQSVLLESLTVFGDSTKQESTDTVFLRVLYEGALYTLYNLNDFKTRFYVKDAVNGYRELEFGQKLVETYEGKEYVQTVQGYKSQLAQYAANSNRSPVLQSEAERLKYSEKSLLKFTKLVHNDQEKIKPAKKRLFPFVGAGLSVSRYTIEDEILLDGMNFKSSVTPVFTVGVDLFGKRSRSLVTFRAAVQYFQMKIDGEKTTVGLTNERKDYTYKININSVSPSISALFTIYNKNEIRVYAGPTVAVNFSKYQNQLFTQKNSFGTSVSFNRTELNYFFFESWWLNVHAMAGVSFRNKWHFDVSRNFEGTFSKYINFNFNASILQARLAYRF